MKLGRRDSTTASRSLADSDLPGPFSDLKGLISKFSAKNLNAREMVALSGTNFLPKFIINDKLFVTIMMTEKCHKCMQELIHWGRHNASLSVQEYTATEQTLIRGLPAPGNALAQQQEETAVWHHLIWLLQIPSTTTTTKTYGKRKGFLPQTKFFLMEIPLTALLRNIVTILNFLLRILLPP